MGNRKSPICADFVICEHQSVLLLVRYNHHNNLIKKFRIMIIGNIKKLQAHQIVVTKYFMLTKFPKNSKEFSMMIKFISHTKVKIQLINSSTNVVTLKPVQVNIIYQIICDDYSKRYIGQTGPFLRTRKIEHERNVIETGHNSTLMMLELSIIRTNDTS